MRFGYKVGIVAVLSSFLLMSHNANAITMTFDATQYTPVVRQVYNLVDCSFVVGNNTYYQNSVSNCYSTQGALSPNVVKVKKIVTSNSITFKKGDIVEFDIIAYHEPAAYFENFAFRAFKLNDVNNFYMMGYESVLNIYNHDSWVNSSGNAVHYQDINQIMRFRVYVQNDVYTPIGLYATDTNNNPIATYNEASQDIKWNLINLTVYRKTGKSSVNQEQEEATQNAADESESEAQDNSTNSQTTNLIGAFQSFVTALTNLNSTNCNVSLPFPTALGGSMQVNICQNKDYAGNIVSVFGSLTLIVFYIPFSLKILSMIYNEIRSFTNG